MNEDCFVANKESCDLFWHYQYKRKGGEWRKKKKVKVLFYPGLPDFLKNIAFWKASRLRPFVLLVRALVEWYWQGKTEVLGENHVLLPICQPQISHRLTWDFFFLSRFFSLIHFVPLNPSLLLHVTYVPYYCPYTINTTQTSMPSAGFEPTIPVSERPQTHALDRTATGIEPGPPRWEAGDWPPELWHGLDWRKLTWIIFKDPVRTAQ